MNILDQLQQQHYELLDIASALSLHLQLNRIAETAEALNELLTSLGGRLRIHLAMEDRGLYPLLLEGQDEAAKKLAREFMEDAVGFAARLRKYLLRWSMPHLIAEHPRDFARETRDLLQELSSRIECEEKELYPLLQKVG